MLSVTTSYFGLFLHEPIIGKFMVNLVWGHMKLKIKFVDTAITLFVSSLGATKNVGHDSGFHI